MKRNAQTVKRQGRARDGFTWTEFAVVVIVIAAVIVILVPVLVSNIRQAREKGEIEETRTVTIALQAILSLANGDDVSENDMHAVGDTGFFHTDPKSDDNMTLTAKAYAEMEALAMIKLGYVDRVKMRSAYTVESFRYRTPNGSLVEYQSGEYTVLELYAEPLDFEGIPKHQEQLEDALETY
jgi:competence protein ComGC